MKITFIEDQAAGHVRLHIGYSQMLNNTLNKRIHHFPKFCPRTAITAIIADLISNSNMQVMGVLNLPAGWIEIKNRKTLSNTVESSLNAQFLNLKTTLRSLGHCLNNN